MVSLSTHRPFSKEELIYDEFAQKSWDYTEQK